MRYVRGLDRVDEQLIRSAFHADAVDHHGPVSGSVDDFLAFWLPVQENREVSEHYITNHSVELDGDSAHAETYFLFFCKLEDDAVMRVSGGRYIDRFERREGEWKIALRVVISEWQMHADGEPTVVLRSSSRAVARTVRISPTYAHCWAYRTASDPHGHRVEPAVPAVRRPPLGAAC